MNKPFHLVQSLRFIGELMELTVDGRTYAFDVQAISNRLAKASAQERNTYEVSPSGYGIHWPLIDEDLAIDGLLQSAGAAPAHSALHEPPAEYHTD
jgi:hypothetical protein